MIQAQMRVPFSYLDRQFADIDIYLAEVKNSSAGSPRCADFRMPSAWDRGPTH
jgi:hypothetical protein